MAATNRLLNSIRSSVSLLSPRVSASSVTGGQQWQCIRWYSVEYNDKYYEKLVKGSPVVLFIKGTPDTPMCGFSRLVIQILKMHGLEGYDHHNVLEDMDFKEGMKEYSKWPTFPQVYMNGELVGGADIMLQMHQNGELVEELQKVGHKSTLLDEDGK